MNVCNISFYILILAWNILKNTHFSFEHFFFNTKCKYFQFLLTGLVFLHIVNLFLIFPYVSPFIPLSLSRISKNILSLFQKTFTKQLLCFELIKMDIIENYWLSITGTFHLYFYSNLSFWTRFLEYLNHFLRNELQVEFSADVQKLLLDIEVCIFIYAVIVFYRFNEIYFCI